MAHRHDIDAYLQQLLEVSRFADYGPNGLQVEGRSQVRHLASGVTASLAFIEAAIEVGADALLVHHGLFWRGQDGRVTGWMKQRLQALLREDINLYAYHLPLDAHPALGNNAQLARHLGWRDTGRFGDKDLGWIGAPTLEEDADPVDLDALIGHLQARLGRAPVAALGDGRQIRRVAWCTGGAQGWFESAIAAGADVYVTGEISEPQAHLARETGVAFLACGHHATERYGAPAVAAEVARHFGLQHTFLDLPNPA